MLIDSIEYPNTLLKSGEFILQAFGSKADIRALTDCECIYYRFAQLEIFCEERFNQILAQTPFPSSYTPLKMVPELTCFLKGSTSYLTEKRVCKDLMILKKKEIIFVLGYYYSNEELAELVHPLFKYRTSFEYFILQNYRKVKTVEELAQLGGYTVSTLRRIFHRVFHEPVYEWMQKRRKEGIWEELSNTNATISEICYGYGFETLAHFSTFCKKNFGDSPRMLRHKKKFD